MAAWSKVSQLQSIVKWPVRTTTTTIFWKKNKKTASWTAAHYVLNKARQTSAPHITVEFVEVQEQNGSDDCGVYAVAFTVALSLGKDPRTLTFAESDIRKHLFIMLNNKKLQLFPVIKKGGELE